MLLPDLHPLMFSSLFPFVNPYQPEGVNQATPDSLDLLLSEGGGALLYPKSTELSSISTSGLRDILEESVPITMPRAELRGTTSCIVRRSGCSE